MACDIEQNPRLLYVGRSFGGETQEFLRRGRSLHVALDVCPDFFRAMGRWCRNGDYDAAVICLDGMTSAESRFIVEARRCRPASAVFVHRTRCTTVAEEIVARAATAMIESTADSLDRVLRNLRVDDGRLDRAAGTGDSPEEAEGAGAPFVENALTAEGDGRWARGFGPDVSTRFRDDTIESRGETSQCVSSDLPATGHNGTVRDSAPISRASFSSEDGPLLTAEEIRMLLMDDGGGNVEEPARSWEQAGPSRSEAESEGVIG